MAGCKFGGDISGTASRAAQAGASPYTSFLASAAGAKPRPPVPTPPWRTGNPICL